jgi:2-(1,2-epoxy-1,2-dihydrophenyl)acetyl-CoA isomerase
MTTSPVHIERDGAIATLVFNRPEQLNALDLPSAQAFAAACASLAQDAGVRAVVLRGQGRCFGAGGDLQSFAGNDPAEHAGRLIDAMHQGLMHLAALNAPVIASLHGSVAGGSMSLALGCDLAIAADNSRFNLAYAKVAANCDVGGSWSLPRLVGLRRAMQIALLSETINADDALALGLVNRVVPFAELGIATRDWAERLAQGPTLAYGRMKRLLRGSFDHDLATQLELEKQGFQASATTDDFAEAVAAFFARRPAQFNGR